MTEQAEYLRDGEPDPNFVSIEIEDMTQKGWHVELTHGENWGCAQLASVNTRSDLVLPADDGDGTVPFTGWRVTLSKKNLQRLRDEADALLAKMPDK